MDCWECGSFNSMLAKECGECGAPLGGQKAAAGEQAAAVRGGAPRAIEWEDDVDHPARVARARGWLLLISILGALTLFVVLLVDPQRVPLIAIWVSSNFAAYIWSRRQPLAGLLLAFALLLFNLAARVLAPVADSWAMIMYDTSLTGLAEAFRATIEVVVGVPLVVGAMLVLLARVMLTGAESAAWLAANREYAEGAREVSRALHPALNAFAWMLGVGTLFSAWVPASVAGWLVSELCVITPFLVLIYRARRELWEAYRRPRWSRSALILAGLSPLLFQVAISAVHGLGFDFLSWTEPWVAADWSVAGLVLIGVIVTPALEEVIFRGYLQQRLETLLSARQALFVQAVLFAVAHLSVPNLISHFVIGLLLGRLRQVTRSLYLSFAVHALWNLWVTLGELELF